LSLHHAIILWRHIDLLVLRVSGLNVAMIGREKGMTELLLPATPRLLSGYSGLLVNGSNTYFWDGSMGVRLGAKPEVIKSGDGLFFNLALPMTADALTRKLATHFRMSPGPATVTLHASRTEWGWPVATDGVVERIRQVEIPQHAQLQTWPSGSSLLFGATQVKHKDGNLFNDVCPSLKALNMADRSTCPDGSLKIERQALMHLLPMIQ
jgi:hypothetical protein